MRESQLTAMHVAVYLLKNCFVGKQLIPHCLMEGVLQVINSL